VKVIAKMNLQIAKWGNSLAIRIPNDVVRTIGFKEGDLVEGSLTADGGLSIRPRVWDRKAFADELSAARDSDSGATSMASFDLVLCKNAKSKKLKLVFS
jgi:antitoxin MazE